MGILQVVLTNGQVAIIDEADAPLIAGYSWRELKMTSTRTTYAQANVPRHRPKKTVLMHRLIAGVTDRAVKVDHRDGNGLNNVRDNLRPATHTQNARNARKHRDAKGSKFKGVIRRGRRWVAQICVNRNTLQVGTFDAELDAAAAYDNAAAEHHGVFARINFPA